VDADTKVDQDSPKHGDISPINGSISNLADDGKASTTKAPRKVEPTSEILPNFSRVTPAQLAHITFPADGRYQPVRAVTTKSVPAKNGKISAAAPPTAGLGLASEKYAGGGGILILTDLRPDEEAEFIDLNPPPPAETAQVAVPNGHAPAGPPATGRNIVLDESVPEAEVPEPFEVRRQFL
jgi:26S proteasome regulatory subunit N2